MIGVKPMKKTLSMLVVLVAILAATVQPALAAANSWDLNVHNNTEDPVKITLTGPKNYNFTVDPGKWLKTVVEGTYKYSYTACGEKFTGEIKVTDDNQWLQIALCEALPEYAKFVVDSHLAQALTLTLTGPETYSLALALGTNRFISLQTGWYTYSYEACGQTISGSVRVLKNGTGRLTAYACEQLGNHLPETNTGGSAAASNLRIGSHYSFPVRITLLGPNNYSFELFTGLNRLNVLPGEYSYFYTAYGQYKSGTFTIREAGVNFIISPLR
jgi:hypothetical protein